MASAIHNVDGPADIPLGEDLKDGAGGIDVALADKVAQLAGSAIGTCTEPCWWNLMTTSSSPPKYGSVIRYFKASRGERIRVAISWWSSAEQPLGAPNVAEDELRTNYNLYVYAPGGSRFESKSRYNNYELVDFVAPATGQYTIRVYRSGLDDDNEPDNRLGIAWVKDATYLPDLRRKDGWVSEFHACNNGAVIRSDDSNTSPEIFIHYFEPDGDPTTYGSDHLIFPRENGHAEQ